jgi:hypothetical protein
MRERERESIGSFLLQTIRVLPDQLVKKKTSQIFSLLRPKNGATTFTITTLTITTFTITTLAITTLAITTLTIMTLNIISFFATISINGTRHKRQPA